MPPGVGGAPSSGRVDRVVACMNVAGNQKMAISASTGSPALTSAAAAAMLADTAEQ
jgi:hypothetical protein